MGGETPYLEVFIQYGPVFHYIYGLLLFLSNQSLFFTKLMGLVLIICNCVVFYTVGGHRYRIEKTIAIILWLFSCYWFLPYDQYFVQFHPSQLCLVFFSLSLKITVDLVHEKSPPFWVLIALPFAVLVTFFSKMNFGILLALALFFSLLILPQMRRWLKVYFCIGAVSVAVILVMFFLASPVLLEDINFFKQFTSTQNLLSKFGLSTIYLDVDHGGVKYYQRLFFLLPGRLLLLLFPNTAHGNATCYQRNKFQSVFLLV